jgi:hypothetical protein
VDTARRPGVSTEAVSKYRPCRRPHLNENEFDEVVSAWRVRSTTIANTVEAA